MVKGLILQQEKFTIIKNLKISRLEEKNELKSMLSLWVMAIQGVQDFCARPIIKRVLTCKIFEKLFRTLKRICHSTEVET